MNKLKYFVLILISNFILYGQEVTQDNTEKVIPKDNPVQSAQTSVKLNTPTLNMDVLLDLYNKDIDFSVDYTGKSFTKPKSIDAGSIPLTPDKSGDMRYDPNKPVKQSLDDIEEAKKIRDEDLSSEITDIIDTSKYKRKGNLAGTYSKEDADYNKALYNLQIAQNLFSRKKYVEALTEIDKSIVFAPNLALAHAVKGSILFVLKKREDAKTSWERALELDPAMDNVRAILYRMN